MSLRRQVHRSQQEIAHRTLNNPYVSRLDEKPGRIFQFKDFESDKAAVLALLEVPAKNIFVELGSGSGNHLIARAMLEPSATFFGVELRFKRVFRTIEKAERAQTANVYALKTNAIDVPLIFPNNSIAGVFINFPDPWEKNRLKKHRLLQSEFLTSINRVLRPGGFVSFKTDHREYFETVLRILETRNDYNIAKQSFDLHRSAFVETNVRSEFEELFLSQGLPVYFCEFHSTLFQSHESTTEKG